MFALSDTRTRSVDIFSVSLLLSKTKTSIKYLKNCVVVAARRNC